MGGKVSKARRACLTDRETKVNASGDITGTGLGAGVDVKSTYDTQCVQNILSGK
jgi:hypothetical protein